MNHAHDRRYGGRVTLYYASCACGWKSDRLENSALAAAAAGRHMADPNPNARCPQRRRDATVRRTWIPHAERGAAT